MCEKPNEHRWLGWRLSASIACLLTCVNLASGQEIRRAVPVQTPFPSVEPEIRRAVPVQPLAPLTPSPTPTPLPLAPSAPPYEPGPVAANGSVNDTARFLAGLPLAPDSPLVPLTQDPEWQRHAAVFDQAWARLAARQFNGIRDWEANYLPDAGGPLPVVFYLFSGPDFLYANQFFPDANTYILAGTEPIGPLPDVAVLSGPAMGPALQNFETALNSVLSFSFFITKDMKTDLEHAELKGTLPIFYVFLARSGKTITNVTFITLNKSGDPQISTASSADSALTPGVRITFVGAPESRPQTLYYFTTDLSDGGIRSHPGFLKFCEQQGTGDSLLKSASYLMFEPGFATVRNFLLTHSHVLIQDDSGIPITAFDQAKWDLRLCGSYSGPIEIFKKYYQPELQALYAQSHPFPIEFGIGYRWQRNESTLIVALHK